MLGGATIGRAGKLADRRAVLEDPGSRCTLFVSPSPGPVHEVTANSSEKVENIDPDKSLLLIQAVMLEEILIPHD